MLAVQVWDELSNEWSKIELETLSPTERNPHIINDAIERHNAGDDADNPWDIIAVGQTEGHGSNVLTIELEDDRGHQCLILVNPKDQENT